MEVWRCHGISRLTWWLGSAGKQGKQRAVSEPLLGFHTDLRVMVPDTNSWGQPFGRYKFSTVVASHTHHG